MELNELQKNRLLKDSGFPINDSLLKKDNINELRLLKDSGFSTSDGTNLIASNKNRKDLEDVPDNVAKDMVFHFAKEIKDVLKVAVPKIYTSIKKSNNSQKK